MWLSFFKRRGSQRTYANPLKTTRRSFRPQLEALEDRLAPSATPLYSFSSANTGWGIAVDAAGNAYFGGDGTIGKLGPSGGSYQTLQTLATQSGYGYGQGNLVALDSSGNIYVANLGSTITPTANAFSSTPSTVSVEKLDPNGNVLYATYIPGTNYGDVSMASLGIAVDGAGDVYVCGAAGSGFVTTPNAYQQAYAGTGGSDAFLAEFNPALSGSASLVYGTFLGGALGNGSAAGYSHATGIALDNSGNAYITGVTQSSDFPTTPGAFQTAIKTGADTFVSKFNTALSGSASLVYSTFLGGSGIADGGFVSRGSPFINGGRYYTTPAIAVDGSGSAYVTGETDSSDFPTTAGAFSRTYHPTNSLGGDAYITKFTPDGSGLAYSTYLGGSDVDVANGIMVDAYGNATVSGGTRSTDFPTVNPFQATNPGSPCPFVTTLNASGSALVFSTYLPNSGMVGRGIAQDSGGNVYVTGGVSALGAGFVTKISAPVCPSFSVSGFPATVTAGTSGTITVTALNADGTVNTGYSGTVHFSSSDPQAVLPANATLTNGTGTFSVTLKTAGTQSITVADTGNAGIAGSESGISVKAAAATHFAISGPSSVAAGTSFSITVTALDAYGNVATGYRGTIHFSDSVSGATLPANYTFTASDNGVHTFTGLKLKTKGMQTITIVDTLDNTIIGVLNLNVT
jgi:hypothetical protein